DLIGHDLVDDEREHVKDAVAYAIANAVVVINGPFELIHGGNGIVFRKAVFEDGEFTAIINLVVNYDNLNSLFEMSESTVVDIGIYSTDNSLLFGSLVYSEDLSYLAEFDIVNVDWEIGIQVSDSYRFITRLTNIIILTVSIALYSVLVVIGFKVYKSNKNLILKQNELIYYDNLTSLPNRRLLSRDVKKLLKDGEVFYLGFGDLDNFKNLNDILGHSVGDAYLEDISKRFEGIISDNLRIYRWGGDEFIFLMKSNNRKETRKLINSIYKVFEDPIAIRETNYYVSISIGIVNFPLQGKTMDDLIKRADIVMYDIKSQKKNTYGFFEDKYLDNLQREVDFENKVNSYSLNDFEVFLQPVLYTENQEIYGFEGLVRLFDENNKLINTQELIKVFERKGEISKLDEFVFEEVCKHSISFKKEFNKDYTYSFNISPITLSKDFIKFLKKTIKKYEINPKYFVMEIIETLGFKDFDESLILLEELRTLGFRIAMDDFGMGYSSLSYITKLPLSIIKIDRHFVHNYQKNDFDKMIMLTIKDISKSLNIEIIVEGIETVEQLDFIKQIGAHYFQGYLHSKAMRYKDVVKLIKSK
ncbi:MAG: bifunctional diguanylate cyclase/phosphodiesterase, partial [Candidatus Izimaplasma sp.]|nr:bifunctional diguanylate cyclase/phosphodiesterase [Candidatus Izimaplasma bacterium]